ncbi:structural maintenance of chromosomes protein 4 [Coccinella septempunctata]|uniref:structural maintenance of chromosomes protein 4 n=1 Tax=Coccinella septempunctata TaxID=41139 RepID=UPI001D092F4A|nr:structural maintenance of chromosomes protein 4 [Coccinella septempunctata]
MNQPSNNKRKSTALNTSVDEEDDVNFSDEEGTRVDGIYIPPPTKPVCSFDPTGPRLIITKIVNNFFKSYANEQTLGPFHKCFNAIIGPNGSGKSNVIDSMLFVFGYRATKIRCKKVSVLLHNSENYPNVQSATVEVHFAQIIDKEGDEYDIIPGSEFVVTRTAMKDNSSYYTLNGSRVHFKEVAVLLKKHGIDLDHNRFLILQGEVEQIAMMKCKADNPNEPGMLEYLEDIIGTSRYIKPLELLNERVETLSDARSEKVNRLKLVQKELEELQGPMAEAVDYLKAENTVATCKNILYQKNIFDLEDELQASEEEKNGIQTVKNEISGKIESITKSKVEKEEALNKESEKYSSLQKRKNKLKEAFERANNKDVELQAEMVQVNKNRKKTMELLAEEKKKLQQYEKTPEESEKGIEECMKKEEKLSHKKQALDAEKTELLATIKTETKPLQEKKEILENELVELKRSVDETKSAYALAESELKLCMTNEENEKNKYETLKSSYESANSLIRQRQDELVALKTKIPLTEKSLRGASSELNAVRDEETRIRMEINKKRAHLEESRSSMNASKSKTKVLDSLMKQKEDGNCPGLFGRLGDLGAIDQKYDVAISTACGPLDNIVVDSVSTAQWCIEFLKQYDIGRATFIALEKQEHLRHYATSRIQTPENVPRLYDLVRVQDDRVRTAFYYALRDTLVANDLDQASRIAYGSKRYRVVTLKGDLIETTGTMSGGGRSVLRGRMGQSVAVSTTNQSDLDKVEKELQVLEERFRYLRERQATLENQINALEPELKQMKMNYEKFSLEIKSLTQQQPDLLKQLKAQEAKARATKSDEAQVKKLTAIVEARKAEYEEAFEVAGKLQVQVDKLTSEIKEKTIGKMKKMDKSINEVVDTMNKLKTEINKLKVAVKTAERNAIKSAEKISTMEQDIKSCETRLKEMSVQRNEIESDGAKLLKCLEEIEVELNSGDYEFGGIKAEVEALKKKLNKLKSEEVDIDQKIKTANEKINNVKSAMHQWHVKVTQLKLQDIPETTLEELKKYTKEELEEKNLEIVEKDLRIAENKLKSEKPNLGVIQEYRKKQDRYMERAKELDEISQKRQEVKNVYDNLREQRKTEFLTGFQTIRMKLKEMYQMITLGGDADFELVDTFDPFTEGIQFNVRPPKKSWKKISNLSGGEKTLSSLALVFALHYYKPSPLYVMDEIDAALDFKNVSIVGHYIKDRTKNAQFIIISLRSQMFELCDHLIGIYKTYNCTKSIAIDPRIYDEKEEDQVVPTAQHQRLQPSQGTRNSATVRTQNETQQPMQEETQNETQEETRNGAQEETHNETQEETQQPMQKKTQNEQQSILEETQQSRRLDTSSDLEKMDTSSELEEDNSESPQRIIEDSFEAMDTD